jgi:hypothetical protein
MGRRGCLNSLRKKVQTTIVMSMSRLFQVLSSVGGVPLLPVGNCELWVLFGRIEVLSSRRLSLGIGFLHMPLTGSREHDSW